MNTKEKQVEVVRIGSADYSEFSALLEWASSGSEAANTDRYQTREVLQFMQRYQVLDSDTFFFYAARVDGKLVAYVNAVLIPKPDPRLGVMYVDALWTAPPYRGQGIARKLLQQVRHRAKEMNLWRVRLYVSRDNHSARSCYRKAGFAEIDEGIYCEVGVGDLSS